MKRYLLLALFYLSYTGFISAQDYQKPIITADRTGDGLFDFYAENQNPYPIQMRLTFTQLENMQVMAEQPFVTTLFTGKQKLFHLRRIMVEMQGQFDYKTEYLTGAFPVRYDSTVVYQLPIVKGRKTMVSIMDQTQKGGTAKKSILFKMVPGDTVTAARDGIIAQIIRPREINGRVIGSNTIVILHPDNSFGRYEQLADNGFLVEPGQKIEAGAPIGLVPNEGEPHLVFSVYHVNAPINRIIDERIRDYQTYILPEFLVSRMETKRLVHASENKRDY